MRKWIVASAALALAFLPQLSFAQTSANPAPAAAATNSSAPSIEQMTPEQRDLLRARIYMAKKQYADAARMYEQLSKEHPRNPAYWNSLGLAHLQQSDMKTARKDFQRATKVDKKYADGYNNLGAIYYAQKKYKNSIREYRRALKLQPTVAGLYTNLGYAYFAQKKYPQAMDAFHQALVLDPGVFGENDRNGSLMTYRSVGDHGLFDFMLAKGYAQNGDAPHCAEYLRKALDEGYKDVLKARTDPAFAKVLTDTKVQAVLDLAAPPAPAAVAPPPGF